MGDQAAFASFLICAHSLLEQGDLQSGAGVPSALSSFLDLAQACGSHLPHIAHSSPTRAGCEGDEKGQRREIWWSESKVGGCAPRRRSTARTWGGARRCRGPSGAWTCATSSRPCSGTRRRRTSRSRTEAERKSRVSDRVGQDLQSKNAPPSRCTWRRSGRPCSPSGRRGRAGSPWRGASSRRLRSRTRGRRSRRQPARRREVRWKVE